MIFDMNTLYKHEQILSEQVFIYDTQSVYCVWQNHFTKNSGKVNIDLTFFEKQGKHYIRSDESFTETAYETAVVKNLLQEAGFGKIEVFEAFHFTEEKKDSQRVIFAAKKT